MKDWESKAQLDAIARALHPDWPEGARKTYAPDSLADMVNLLHDEITRLRADLTEARAIVSKLRADPGERIEASEWTKIGKTIAEWNKP